MKIVNLRAVLGNVALMAVSVVLAGCPCPACDKLTCGEGTTEIQIGEERTCVVTPLTCGDGAHEQATGGQRECVPTDPGEVLECGTGTYEQEPAVGGQRECVPGTSTCPAGQIEVLNADNTKSCMSGPLACAEGTHEQATGGQRECVPNDTNLSCGDGTQEQATGGQRECVPAP